MKILILGLGPIGSVYGYVFKKADCSLFYKNCEIVKEKYYNDIKK